MQFHIVNSNTILDLMNVPLSLGGDTDMDNDTLRSSAYQEWRIRHQMTTVAQALAQAISDHGASYPQAQARYRQAMRALVDATDCGLMPQPNLPMLRKGLEWVEWSDERKKAGDVLSVYWDQGTWRAVHPKWSWADEARSSEVLSYAEKDCKTSMCFAGFTADAAGVQWQDPQTGDDSVVPLTEKLVGDYPEVVASLKRQAINGERDAQGERTQHVTISDFAREVLGLSDAEAGYLFAGNNKVPDIRRVIAVAAERVGERI